MKEHLNSFPEKKEGPLAKALEVINKILKRLGDEGKEELKTIYEQIKPF